MNVSILWDLYNDDDNTALQDVIRDVPSLMRGLGWADLIWPAAPGQDEAALLRSEVSDGFTSLMLLEDLLVQERNKRHSIPSSAAPAWARAYSVGGYGRPPFDLSVPLLSELANFRAHLIVTIVS